jgi:hypothetical protein
MMGEMISGMLCNESKFALYSKESFSFLAVVQSTYMKMYVCPLPRNT